VFRTSITVAMDDQVLVGIAHAKYSDSGSPDTSRSDEFLVCQGTGDLSAYDAPGLRECTQLLQVNGFEGNPETVSEYWDVGATGPATARTGYHQYRGAFSMRLHDSLGGNFPVCDVLDPWISQEVEIPVIPPEVLTITRITLEGYRISGGSLADCSVYNTIDYDDQLYAQIQDGAGNPSALLWPPVAPTPTPTPGPSPTPGPPTDTPTPAPTSTSTPTPTPTVPPTTLLDVDFDAGADGFAYLDDAFRGTNRPIYADGQWLPSGGFAGGGLQVEVGGVDGVDVTNGMSGGWQETIIVGAPAADATLSFRYNLTQSPEYESDECSQVLVSFDGALNGQGGNDYVVQVCGDGSGGSDITTGWQLFQVNLGTLSVGSHNLTIGGYNNKKTYADESTEILIDDVFVEGGAVPPTPTNTPTATPGPSPTPGPTSTPGPTAEAPVEVWEPFSIDFTGDVDLAALSGQPATVRFYATHDADEYGTWFYLDEVECNVCKELPIPDVEPGTASFGGLVRGMTGAVPQVLTGVRVVAYSYGGQVYRTLSIHDGTYHFYNVPPGTYVIYAQTWVGGYLLVDSSSVTVVADERNYSVHLLLQ
jgi:hypothetical protein